MCNWVKDGIPCFSIMTVLKSVHFNPTVQIFISLCQNSCQVPWFKKVQLSRNKDVYKWIYYNCVHVSLLPVLQRTIVPLIMVEVSPWWQKLVYCQLQRIIMHLSSRLRWGPDDRSWFVVDISKYHTPLSSHFAAVNLKGTLQNVNISHNNGSWNLSQNCLQSTDRRYTGMCFL
jgi:hypothetical protein